MTIMFGLFPRRVFMLVMRLGKHLERRMQSFLVEDHLVFLGYS
jgi:hypothetical protein